MEEEIQPAHSVSNDSSDQHVNWRRGNKQTEGFSTRLCFINVLFCPSVMYEPWTIKVDIAEHFPLLRINDIRRYHLMSDFETNSRLVESL